MLKQKKKRVGLVTKVLIAAFAIYAACTLVNLQLRINAAAQEQTRLQEQLEAQQLTRDELEDAVSGDNQENYVAKIARDALGYVYPGEQVYIDISSK